MERAEASPHLAASSFQPQSPSFGEASWFSYYLEDCVRGGGLRLQGISERLSTFEQASRGPSRSRQRMAAFRPRIISNAHIRKYIQFRWDGRRIAGVVDLVNMRE